MQCENPLSIQSGLFSCSSGGFGSSGNQRFRKSGQILFVIYNQFEGIRFFQYVLPESQLQDRYLFIQFTQPGLLVSVEIGSATYETFVGFLQQLLLLLIQIH